MIGTARFGALGLPFFIFGPSLKASALYDCARYTYDPGWLHLRLMFCRRGIRESTSLASYRTNHYLRVHHFAMTREYSYGMKPHQDPAAPAQTPTAQSLPSVQDQMHSVGRDFRSDHCSSDFDGEATE